ncbi:uncharacterized protein B0H64DRAFT_400967 [Chaetomium fimeti]|uniref:Protein kinase domain-containing protein n=1 Tax=Chaetomium fimeti TaxID=1854472 RepID=A0AAE0LR81_9PEZI|nr:hypothetical protein B0H64DRAFT_400967 [Chaetomium fimeti]
MERKGTGCALSFTNAGVINTDCQPRNVVVQRESLRPLHIDFGHCLFAEDMGWQEFGETKVRLGNQGAIGSTMVGKLRRAGVDVPGVRYTNRDWGLLGSILSRFCLALTHPWARFGYGVGVGVLAWVVVRGISAFRAWF